MQRFLFSVLFSLVSTGFLLAQIQLPANMYADSTFLPFLYGVASGDPLADRAMIWTKIDPQGQSNPISLNWEVAADPGFATLVTSGTILASGADDWTVTLDVAGLLPGSRYYYRFQEPGGQYTRVGRTQTAPAGNTSHVRMAIASCSSVFSGFFNAYARIGERNDLDLVVHLGDYIYDFVDPDEAVRVPTPVLPDPATLTEWRYQHEYYLLDPDLRLARQMHPWAVIWDNHDIDGDGNPQQVANAIQAFHEYVPVRLQDTTRSDLIYRKLQYGNLVDILLMDVQSLRDVDTLSGNELSILGNDQWTWLSQELTNSTAQWRILAQQKMLAQFSTQGLPSFIPFGDGPVADSGSWDGYNTARVQLLDHLVQQNLDNNIVLGGDIHMSFASDLAPNLSVYDPQTGLGSVAVEFMPASITRGNFDEAGFGGFLAGIAAAAIALANPHHVYAELEDHGYGILDIRPDSAVAEFWYSPILAASNSENFGTGYVVRAGDNHWDRNARNNPLVARAEPRPESPLVAGPFPNPGQDHLRLQLNLSAAQEVEISLCELGSGRQVRQLYKGLAHSQQEFTFEVRGLAAGIYGLIVRGADFMECNKWTVQ